MAKRYELPDAAWALVADLFTETRRTGRPRAMIAWCSMVSSGYSVLAQPGETCLSDSALGQRSISDSVTGVIAQRLIRCSSGFMSD